MTNETKNRGGNVKYPFINMDVGESVYLEGAHTAGKEYAAAQGVGRHKGWKFSGKKEVDGMRVTRIA